MMAAKYERCEKCNELVLASRMADHWVIARHYSVNLPAVSFPSESDRPSGLVLPSAYRRVVPSVLRQRAV